MMKRILHLPMVLFLDRGRRGHDCMVVEFTTTYAISVKQENVQYQMQYPVSLFIKCGGYDYAD
jgi:hypothetical protein